MKKLFLKYKVFIKYIVVAVISFLIDISLFTMFNTLIGIKIILATITARIISSFINFLLNKKKVFKSDSNKYIAFIKYYGLVIIQMLVSAFMVNYIYNNISINATLIKIPVEGCIFVVNYFVQKYLIFRSDYEK